LHGVAHQAAPVQQAWRWGCVALVWGEWSAGQCVGQTVHVLLGDANGQLPVAVPVGDELATTGCSSTARLAATVMVQSCRVPVTVT
jgi:hypothetical protein